MKNKKSSRKPKKLAACLASLLAGVALFIPAGCGDKNNNTNPNPNNNFQIVVDSSIEEENQNLSVTAGTTIATLKSQLEVEGYDLEGLYKDEEYTQPYEDSYVLQSGDKVYCKYEIKHFTITLNDEDWYEIVPEGELTNVEYGSEFKFKVTYTEERDEAAIKVTANDEVLTKGQDEYYTTTIKADTTINVQIKTYTITIPEQVRVTYKSEPLQTGAIVRHGDEITVSYTKKVGYTQTLTVNGEPQTDETKTYIVTEDIVITYEEVATPYTLTINEQDKLNITLNGEPLNSNEVHIGDMLQITAKETLENYNQLIIVEGADKQEDETYKVTGNVVVTYLEIDKQLRFTYKSNNECYEVEALNKYISGKIVIPAIYTDGESGVHKVEIPDIAFSSASKITEIVISEGIEKIGTRAFSYCSGIVSVTLPESLTTIGDNAFEYCRKLIEVINKSQNIQLEKGSDAFGGVAKYAYVLEADESKKGDFTKVENGIKYYENTNVQEPALIALGFEKAGDSRKELTFEPSTTAIGYQAFMNNQKITTLILPEGLKQIGYQAFMNNQKITTLILPEELKLIDDGAFDSCTKLTKITWPTSGSLKRIGKAAFYSCFYTFTNLTLELPEGLESIGGGAFSDMSCLENEVKIVLPTTLKTIEGGAFSIDIPTDGPAALHTPGKIVSVTVQSNIEFPDNEKVFGNDGLNEVIVRNAEIYKNITDAQNSQGNLFYDMQSGATIKVLKSIVDDAENNPMPEYLSESFTKSPDDTDQEYYIFTKNAE